MISGKQELIVFWFRRDLRLRDNAGLYHALKQGKPVLPLFIFDREILDKLDDKSDRRLVFIHRALQEINDELAGLGRTLLTQYGSPEQIWQELLQTYKITAVYTNHDYESYARRRDKTIGELLTAHGVQF
ncbi:MAG: deoxyribodipyrimidine photo-lyase, partial [Bacteroidia bacterium]